MAPAKASRLPGGFGAPAIKRIVAYPRPACVTALAAATGRTQLPKFESVHDTPPLEVMRYSPCHWRLAATRQARAPD